MLKKILFACAIVMLSVGLYAQSVDDVGAKYNEGSEAMKAKQYSEAVTDFEAAIKLADGVGAEANELKEDSESLLVNAYYKNGISKYKSKKFDEAVGEFDKSIALANKRGDSEMAAKVFNVKVKAISNKGLSLIKKKDLDGAYASFEEAHSLKPTCVMSYYGKGKVWKERGDMTQMMENMDKAIEYGATEPKMSKYVKNAKIVASQALISKATDEINKEHGKAAAEYLNDSFKYKAANADTYYNLSVAYNISKEYNNAVETAKKAIAITDGDKSELYFQIGLALEGKGDSVGACDAFKKVIAGPNVETAKYHLTETLKCN